MQEHLQFKNNKTQKMKEIREKEHTTKED